MLENCAWQGKFFMMPVTMQISRDGTMQAPQSISLWALLIAPSYFGGLLGLSEFERTFWVRLIKRLVTRQLERKGGLGTQEEDQDNSTPGGPAYPREN